MYMHRATYKHILGLCIESDMRSSQRSSSPSSIVNSIACIIKIYIHKERDLQHAEFQMLNVFDGIWFLR